MPVLTASAPMSSSTALIWSRTKAGDCSAIDVTPRVFCAVSATIAVMPCAPQRAKALRSAWIPAPPPESDEAMVSTRGITRVHPVGRPAARAGRDRVPAARDAARLGTAARPASTASAIATRHPLRVGGPGDRGGDAARASQPSSIASAASLAVPMPASRITGTPARSTIIAMLCGFRMPSPEPIGAPSGITAAQPASSRRQREHRVVVGVGQHGEAVGDQQLRRVEQLDRVGQQGDVVGDHLELDQVGLQRLAGQPGGEQRLGGGVAAGRVRQDGDARPRRMVPISDPCPAPPTRRIATVVSSVPEAASTLLEHVEGRRAAGADDQPRGHRRGRRAAMARLGAKARVLR